MGYFEGNTLEKKQRQELLEWARIMKQELDLYIERAEADIQDDDSLTQSIRYMRGTWKGFMRIAELLYNVREREDS